MPAKKATPAAAVKKAPPKKRTPAVAKGDAVPGVGKYNLGHQAAQDDLHDVRVPSGALCQARRPGIKGLMKAGLLDSFDTLTALVQNEHIEPNSLQPGTKAKADKLPDPKAVEEGFALVDRLVVAVVVQPALYDPHLQKGETEEKREKRIAEAILEGKLSVEQVDLVDKMFLMNWAVGGSADLESFREGFGETLADISKL